MIGQSSGRGKCVRPKVCHTTMSVPSISRSAFTQVSMPVSPGFWFTNRPAG